MYIQMHACQYMDKGKDRDGWNVTLKMEEISINDLVHWKDGSFDKL